MGDLALRLEAKKLAPALMEIAKPCGGEVVKAILQPLVVVYGLPPGAKASAFWAEYVKALDDLPREALQKAADDYAKSAQAEFFPKPGPLRQLALKHAEPMLKAAHRARKASEKLPSDVPPPTAEGKDAVRRMLAEFHANVDERKAIQPKRPIPPPTPVTFAPGLHVTAAMVEHLQRQDPDFGARDEGGSSVWPVDEDETDPGMFS